MFNLRSILINRQLKYVWIIVFIFIQRNLLALPGLESNFPSHSLGSLKFDVDVCQLDGPHDSTIVEILYSVYLGMGETTRLNSGNKTTLSIELNITGKSGKLINSVVENRSVLLYDSLNPGTYTTFIDIKRFKILPDTVLLTLNVQDSQTKTSGQVAQSFQVRRFENVFSLSDVYFVSHVQRANGASVFAKGGVMLIPNPSRIFYMSGEAQKIFTYYEINNLSYNASNPSFYETNAIVRDIAGNEIFVNPAKQFKITSENLSRIEVIPLDGFNSGVYRLVVEVIDIASGMRRQADGYFQIDKGDISETNILPMSVEDEKKYFDQIKYIASEQEKDIYNQLDPQGKQEFILRFWKRKDPDPSTPNNEFMIEHFRRLTYAEKEITGGINSDMGRVYIMYGSPLDIERQSSSVGSAQAVEIWSYGIEGRTDFIFVDRDGDGEYELVHSTHRNEYSNPDWQEKLSK